MMYRAIRDSGIPRDKVFVTSKLSPYEQGSQKAMEAVHRMVATLGAKYMLLLQDWKHGSGGTISKARERCAGLGYVDLILIHWPGVARIKHDSSMHAQMRIETWMRLEEAHTAGTARSIGAHWMFWMLVGSQHKYQKQIDVHHAA